MGKPDADLTLSDQDGGPKAVQAPFVTPPATTSRPASRRKAQPGPYIETGESSRQEVQRRSPFIQTPHTPASRSSIAEGKRRQRSPTALPVYHPPIPRNESGAPDRLKIRAWKQGVHHARRILLECGSEFRKKQRTHEKLNDVYEAQNYMFRSVGVDEALEELGKSLEVQQRRLDEAEAQGGDDDLSDEDAVEA